MKRLKWRGIFRNPEYIFYRKGAKAAKNHKFRNECNIASLKLRGSFRKMLSFSIFGLLKARMAKLVDALL